MQSENTSDIIDALNQLALGDGNLKVQRASIGFTQAAGLEAGVNGMTLLARSETQNDESIISRVICMLNMITQDEVMDRDAYDG
jgi:splicing factor U2AF subunit